MQVSAIPSFLIKKLKLGVFFNQKTVWNSGAKTDFVNFHHMVLLNSRFAFALTVFPQFLKIETTLKHGFYQGI